MIEREQPPYWSSSSEAPPDPPARRPADDWREHTVPGLQPVSAGGQPLSVAGGDGPGILGFPAEEGEDDAPPADPMVPPRRLEILRRGDVPAGLLLLLAGLAGGASLVLQWVRDDRALGLAAVQRGIRALGAGLGELTSSGLWQPLAVVLGGGVLFVLGVLLFVPARSHRLLGLLALLVAAAAAVGVLVPLAEAGWSPGRFDVGMWFAVSVAALGLLGALKAMLTGPHFVMRQRLR